MNNIFIAAHPRSGSTYFCQLLKGFENINANFELFHPNIEVIKEYLGANIPVVLEHLRWEPSELTRANILNNHLCYLEAVSKGKKNSILTYKVFPDHLSENLMKQQIKESHLVVIFNRNLLHSYISSLVAKKILKWSGADTSEVQVEFTIEGFFSHLKRILNFYKLVEKCSQEQGKVILTIDYEELTSAEEAIVHIKNKIKKIAGIELQLSSDLNIKVKKQDSRKDAKLKVSNSLMMTSVLDKYQLTNLISVDKTVSLEDYKQAIIRYTKEPERVK